METPKTTYAVELLSTNGVGYSRNSMRFATREEAKQIKDEVLRRMHRIFKDARVVMTNDPVNSKIENGKLVKLELTA